MCMAHPYFGGMYANITPCHQADSILQVQLLVYRIKKKHLVGISNFLECTNLVRNFTFNVYIEIYIQHEC